MAFTDDQLERYSRHLILKEIGVRGQKELLAARVLVIGAGGLGSPAAMYLAAAGVGTIGIVDAADTSVASATGAAPSTPTGTSIGGISSTTSTGAAS